LFASSERERQTEAERERERECGREVEAKMRKEEGRTMLR
jgi:hypothetical protein